MWGKLIIAFCVTSLILLKPSQTGPITNCDFIDFNLNHMIVRLSCDEFNGPYQLYRCFDVNFLRRFYGGKVHELRTGDCKGAQLNSSLPAIFANIKSYDISWFGVEQLSAMDLNYKNLQIFNASHNELKKLTKSVFTNSVHLTKMDLSFNKITILESQTFSALDELTHLNLANNLIEMIDEHMFKYNRLKVLRLENNPIKRFDGNIFWPMLNATAVSFTFNHLIEFDSSCLANHLTIAALKVTPTEREIEFRVTGTDAQFRCNKNSFKGLTRFSIAGNGLNDTLEVIELLGPTIELLDLSSNFVGNISPLIFNKFTNLKHLNLRNTHLTSNSHNTIQYLSFANNLESLNVEENAINRIDSNMFALMKMASIKIGISCTQIETIDSSAMKNALKITLTPANEIIFRDLNTNSEIKCNKDELNSLNSLNISGNHLENTRQILDSLVSSIQTLDVSLNSASGLSSFFVASKNGQFNKFVRLQHLNLSRMNLSRISFDPTPYMWMLANLNLSFNHLTTLSFDGNLLQLVQLDASHNELISISAAYFDRLIHLKQLDLSFNRIATIKSHSLSKLMNLQMLNLRSNLMQTIDVQLFESNKMLKQLQLDHNLFHRIDCNLFSSSINLFENGVSCENIAEIDLGCMTNSLKIDLSSKNQVIFRSQTKLSFRCAEQHLQNIKYMNISGAHIPNAHELIERLGTSIKVLDVSANFVGNLTENTFKRLGNLQHLNLSHTNLSNFGFETFYQQRKLQVLDLSYNDLKRVNFTLLLRNFKELTTLNLEGNGLIELDTVSLVIFPRLASLGIARNYFSCDYLAQFLYRWPNVHLISCAINGTHIDGVDCYHRPQIESTTNIFLNDHTTDGSIKSIQTAKGDGNSVISTEMPTINQKSGFMGETTHFEGVDTTHYAESVDDISTEPLNDGTSVSDVNQAFDENIEEAGIAISNVHLIELRAVEILLLLCIVFCVYFMFKARQIKQMKRTMIVNALKSDLIYRYDVHHNQLIEHG